jgi:plastocyanin
VDLSRFKSKSASIIAVGVRLSIAVAVLAVSAACAPTRPATPGGVTSGTATPSTSTSSVPSPAVLPPAPQATSAVPAMVTMTDALRFEPAAITVPKGTTVTWHNASSTVHTVTDDRSKASNAADSALPSGAQAWDSGDIAPGQSFKHTFDTPGTYKYFCKPHEVAGMLGTVVVTG